jgi:pyruvate dehydrogenase (quinone)
MKVGDFVVERLHAWGVRRIYGYPGDGINGVIGALQRAGNIEFIQVRHEEMAAFMAVAHAKFTGELGVCLSTGGPGATHLITGLYDGKLDHAPVLAICGQAEARPRCQLPAGTQPGPHFRGRRGIRAGGFLTGSGAAPPGPMREDREGA